VQGAERVPRKAKSSKSTEELVVWISRLIKENRLEEFYHWWPWRKLSKHVRYELDHNECQICKMHGKYSKADSVHHVKKVKEHPELAMSLYYVDEHGEKQRQLISICEQCHNIEHDKISQWQQARAERRKERYENEEWW